MGTGMGPSYAYIYVISMEQSLFQPSHQLSTDTAWSTEFLQQFDFCSTYQSFLFKFNTF